MAMMANSNNQFAKTRISVTERDAARHHILWKNSADLAVKICLCHIFSSFFFLTAKDVHLKLLLASPCKAVWSHCISKGNEEKI